MLGHTSWQLSGNVSPLHHGTQYRGLEVGNAPPEPCDGLYQILLHKGGVTFDGVLDDLRSGIGDSRAIQPGRALYGDGVNQAVDIGDISQNVLTITAWVKADDITSHTDGVYQLSASDSLSIINGTVTIAGQTGTIRTNDAAGATIANTTSWHWIHVELDSVVDADDTDLLYDGTNYGSIYLFDVRFFGDALSSAEQTAIYDQGLNPQYHVLDQPSDPVGVWYLDDNSQVLSYDASGQGNDGTILNGDAGMLHEGDDVPWSPQNTLGFSD